MGGARGGDVILDTYRGIDQIRTYVPEMGTSFLSTEKVASYQDENGETRVNSECGLRLECDLMVR